MKGDEKMAKNKNKGKKKNRKLILIMAVVLVAAAAVYATASYMLSPVNATDEKVYIKIESGATMNEIVQSLEENGLIRNSTVFKIYVHLRNAQNELKAGRYTFNTNMGAKELTDLLIEGQADETMLITVREGLNVEQIAAYLEEEGLFSADDFLNEIKNNFAYYKSQYAFLASVPDSREYPLEGYLFGDTYEIYVDASPEDVIIKMLDGFDNIFQEAYYARCTELGMTVDQIVTMASIVEREGINDDELPTIAGVFYNRIEDGMLLQSCATLQYIYKDYQFTFTSSQMQIDNPYNTYLYAGLPAGPISNFRVTALEAALYPEDNDYYYFCSKNDGTGASAFAETLSEHEANVSKYGSTWK